MTDLEQWLRSVAFSTPLLRQENMTIRWFCKVVVTMVLMCSVGMWTGGMPERALAQTRIIGGEVAAEGAWPWMAALVTQGYTPYDGQFCGGALIHAKWVLTAAHCLGGSIDVVLGTNDLTASASTYERIAVIQQIAHPSYNSGTQDNDIALLELAEASSQTPIAWNTSSAYNAAGLTSTVIGWGTTSYPTTSYPEMLMQVNVPIVSNATCSASYPGQITSNMLCAGYAAGGKDSCQGDSGGPLMVSTGSGSYVQVGVVSWGDGCALAGYYGVYTRVSNYAAWISSYVSATNSYLLWTE